MRLHLLSSGMSNLSTIILLFNLKTEHININMIHETRHKVNLSLLHDCSTFGNSDKLILNKPTGDFFYDPWVILDEYKGTAIEEVLSVLPPNTGEARIITLKSGSCYYSHSDIDDRYHLNLSGDCAALVNLDNNQNFFLKPDGIWYDMDASPRHSAVNFGEYDRKQLVVRKLLINNKISSPVTVLITARGKNPRFKFDNTLSPWLNIANKSGIITNFKQGQTSVKFDIEEAYVPVLKNLLPKEFSYEY
jgi:hypothetical protein